MKKRTIPFLIVTLLLALGAAGHATTLKVGLDADPVSRVLLGLVSSAGPEAVSCTWEDVAVSAGIAGPSSDTSAGPRPHPKSNPSNRSMGMTLRMIRFMCPPPFLCADRPWPR